ncbi:MAG TPA: hypothetical protein VF101_04050 [Gaiellaceae bacterium]
MRVWLSVLLTAVIAALALAGAAGADDPTIRLTTAGNAAARAAVVQKADLGSVLGWTGGAKKPDLSSGPPCPGFQPKQSDLVVVGAAETDWKRPGLEFDSEAEVMQTPAMVRLDWQRVVLSPKLLPCMRRMVSKTVGSRATVVSVRELRVPRLATYTKGLELLMDVNGAGRTVRVMSDMLFIGRGRTEITLTTTSLYSARSVVQPAEIRLARLLVSRARA